MAKFEKIHAQYPLKFIPTQAHADNLAIVYMLSYGGGVVSGDIFDINISVRENAIMLLLTQGHTKIFKDRIQQHLYTKALASPHLDHVSDDHTTYTIRPSLQIIHSCVSPYGTLIVLPDPVTCFKESSFQSKQTFRLDDATSQLVLLDWFTSGRATRGESWAFRHYSSRIDISVGSKLVIKDAMVLEDEEYMRTNDTSKTSYATRLQHYTCFATLIIISNKQPGGLMTSINTIEKKSLSMRLSHLSLKSEEERSILWAYNPILDGRGTLIRVSGTTTEKVRDFIKYECLHGLQEMIGEGMYNKVLM
ncbi:urease accessory protein UreD [Pilobolus umbonatus]|nr:urease accessory protein UreD [Pilobolus umbonatus]